MFLCGKYYAGESMSKECIRCGKKRCTSTIMLNTGNPDIGHIEYVTLCVDCHSWAVRELLFYVDRIKILDWLKIIKEE